MTQPPETPIEKIIRNIGRGETEHQNRSRTRRKISSWFFPVIYLQVVAAARARDITVSAYAQRAVIAMACYDQGVDYYDVMDGAWPAARYGKNVPDPTLSHGRGAGLWRITGVS